MMNEKSTVEKVSRLTEALRFLNYRFYGPDELLNTVKIASLNSLAQSSMIAD